MSDTGEASWLDVPRMPREAAFGTTSWSLVRRAGGDTSPERRRALEELCALYWYPLYSYLRRRGAEAAEAEDLVQGLLARILERRDLAGLDPGRGRFRAWLVAAARHHLLNEREAARAERRGGGAVASLDTREAEARLAAEGAGEAGGDSPEQAFERAWAQTVLSQALESVRDDWEGRGQGELFAALRPALEDPAQLRPLARIAEDLGMTEGAVRTASWRLRQAFGQHLRAEVTETLSDPADLDDELSHLLLVLSR